MKPFLVHKFLQEVYSSIPDNIDHGLNLIIEYTDDCFLENRFQDCDFLLDTVNLNLLDTFLIVGFLSATRCAKNKLKSRKTFVERARIRLTELAPDRIERLMSGLD